MIEVVTKAMLFNALFLTLNFSRYFK